MDWFDDKDGLKTALLVNLIYFSFVSHIGDYRTDCNAGPLGLKKELFSHFEHLLIHKIHLW
jgi:hypothetical protein